MGGTPEAGGSALFLWLDWLENVVNLESTGALEGLRRLELGDLPAYKAALNQTNRTCWQQYFPFLYFYYVLDGSDELLISEVRGTICIFRLSRKSGQPQLCLYFLPMPMDERVLQECLERVRVFNSSKGALIYWVDEKDIGLLGNLGASVRANPLEREYLYDPRVYRSLSGKKTRELRKNLDRVRDRNNVEVRAFGEADVEDCLALMDEWALIQQDKYERIAYQRYTRNCIKLHAHFSKQDLSGKVVLVEGKIRSFGFAGEIRAGLANLFITYSDHNIKGLNKFLIYNMMLDMQGYSLINSAKADTPGLRYAKESLFPVAMHGMYRAYVIQ
jgi:hypothetical protein